MVFPHITCINVIFLLYLLRNIERPPKILLYSIETANIHFNIRITIELLRSIILVACRLDLVYIAILRGYIHVRPFECH